MQPTQNNFLSTLIKTSSTELNRFSPDITDAQEIFNNDIAVAQDIFNNLPLSSSPEIQPITVQPRRPNPVRLLTFLPYPRTPSPNLDTTQVIINIRLFLSPDPRSNGA